MSETSLAAAFPAAPASEPLESSASSSSASSSSASSSSASSSSASSSSASSNDAPGLRDRVGVWASAACAVHCLATPVLIVMLPAFSRIWAHPLTHVLMACLVVPLAVSVARRKEGVRRWQRRAALLGAALILFGSGLPYLTSEPAAAHSGSAGAPSDAAEAAACGSCCPQVVTDEAGHRHLEVSLAALVTVLGSGFLVSAHAGVLAAARRNRPDCCASGTCAANGRDRTGP